MSEVIQNNESEKQVGYQPVTQRLQKKMSVKFRRETQEVLFDPKSKQTELLRSSSKNYNDKSPLKQQIQQENAPSISRQNSNNQINMFSNVVNVPPFFKENGFFQRRKTFENFVKEGDKILFSNDMTKSSLIQKIQKKTNDLKYLSNNNKQSNEEMIHQEYKKLDQKKSKGMILTNEFWSKKYYDYIIKRSHVKKDMDQFIRKKKLEPTPQLIEKFDNYFMDKFMKNEEDEEIFDQFQKKNSIVISEFLQQSQKSSLIENNSQQKNEQLDSQLNIISPIHAKNSSLKNIQRVISPFNLKQKSNKEIQIAFPSSAKDSSEQALSIKQRLMQKRTSSIEMKQNLTHNDSRIHFSNKEMRLPNQLQNYNKLEHKKEDSERITSFANTLENYSHITKQDSSRQIRMNQQNSQIPTTVKRTQSQPQIESQSLYEQIQKEIITKQDNQKKNNYATLDFYLKVIKQIDNKRFEKPNKQMMQDQFIKSNLLLATQKIKHQRSQSQSQTHRNQYNFKIESPYSIQNLNYNFSSRHSLRSGQNSQQNLNEEDRGSILSMASLYNQRKSSSVSLKEFDFPKEILIDGMDKLIQTCEQFHHENMNVMAVIDKAKDIKNQKKLIKKEQKRQEGILNTLNVLLDRKEKQKRSLDPRNRLQRNKKSKYYYVDED